MDTDATSATERHAPPYAAGDAFVCCNGRLGEVRGDEVALWPQPRWLPPPGWPEPPRGWAPYPGWSPPSAWPPPPPAWIWWLRPRAPLGTKVALTASALVALLALVILFIPVHGTLSGQSIPCGEAAERVFPADPGTVELLPRWQACDDAVGPFLVTAIGTATVAVALAGTGLSLWHRAARRAGRVVA